MTNLFYKLINGISEKEKTQIGEGLNILYLHYENAFNQKPDDLTHILRKIPINQGGGAKIRSKRRSKRRNRKKKSMRGGCEAAVLGAGALLAFFLFYCAMGAQDDFAHDRQTARRAEVRSPTTWVDPMHAQERSDGNMIFDGLGQAGF